MFSDLSSIPIYIDIRIIITIHFIDHAILDLRVSWKLLFTFSSLESILLMIW